MIFKELYKNKIAVIGLGYVGLPLLLEFSKKFKVLGYDINKNRVLKLNNNIDINNDIKIQNIKSNKNLILTCKENFLKDYNIYIITVPTPLKNNNLPDLKPLSDATKTVSKYLTKNDIIIYESTVFPGAIENFCVPILEKNSGLIFNIDFYCGYSPERINPGDKKRTLTKIKKITAGSNKKATNFVDNLYKSIIKAGTYKVKNIQIAEAAKVIENTQRDLNIALVNELSKIFNILNINTKEVLDAASTKWNFIKFNPGLVGGHCIGIDPYYLTFKAKAAGYKPKVILAGRKINDSMGYYVANNLKKILRKKGIIYKKISVLIMGYTFKENCSDIRNTRVKDIVNKLLQKKIIVEIYDPYVTKADILNLKKYRFIKKLNNKKYDAVIIAVSHNIFKKISIKKIKSFCKTKHVIYDLKSLYPKEKVDLSL